MVPPRSHAPKARGEIEAPEAELLRQIRDGDVEAEATLWLRYRERVAFYLRRRTRDPDAAQDLEQEAYLGLTSSIRGGRLSDPGSVASYVYGICSNLAADDYRRARRNVPLEAVKELPAEDDPAERASTQAAVERLRKAFRKLPELEQRILILRFAEEWSHARIGALLGASEEASRQRSHRAVVRLRAVMGPR